MWVSNSILSQSGSWVLSDPWRRCRQEGFSSEVRRAAHPDSGVSRRFILLSEARDLLLLLCEEVGEVPEELL